MTKQSPTSIAKEIAAIEAEAPKKPKRWGDVEDRIEDPLIAEFLKVHPSERGVFLSARRFEAASSILDAYAISPSLRIEDVLACEGTAWKQRMLDRIAGNSKEGIASVSRTFLIAPAYEGDKVTVEVGVRQNKRQHVVITEPIECSPQQAIVALLQHGASSTIPINQGRLVELQSAEDWKPEPMPDEIREVFHNKPEPRRRR